MQNLRNCCGRNKLKDLKGERANYLRRREPWNADFAHSFPFQALLELLIHKGRQVKTISFHLQTGDQQRFTLPIDD